MKRTAHFVLGLVMACAAVCMVTLTSAAPAQAANCATAWNKYGNQPVTNLFKNDGTPFRTGPYTDCTLISTYPAWTDGRYHCDHYNTNGVWWTHLYLSNWDRNGWAKLNDVRAYIPVVTYFC